MTVRSPKQARWSPRAFTGSQRPARGRCCWKRPRPLGLRAAWARVFFVYGPGEPKGRLLGDVIAGLRAGQTVPCTDGLQERDFLATPDIGRALAHLLDCGAEGAVNVASGTAIPVRDLIATAADHMGHPELIDLGARTRPAGDPPRIAAAITRLRTLGFAPRLDLAAGLADAIDRTP